MEMSSPSRTAGVCARKVTLAGVEYTLSNPDRVRKAADEEAVVIARRLDMLPTISRACESLPEDSRQQWRRDYISAMIVGIASPEEFLAYYRSPWQLAFDFWNALDPKHKADPKDPRKMLGVLDGVAWAYEVLNDGVTQEECDSLKLAIRIVSQKDALGNLSGSEGQAATLPMDAHTTADGPQSTPSSPNGD